MVLSLITLANRARHTEGQVQRRESWRRMQNETQQGKVD